MSPQTEKKKKLKTIYVLLYSCFKVILNNIPKNKSNYNSGGNWSLQTGVWTFEAFFQTQEFYFGPFLDLYFSSQIAMYLLCTNTRSIQSKPTET